MQNRVEKSRQAYKSTMPIQGAYQFGSRKDAFQRSEAKYDKKVGDRHVSRLVKKSFVYVGPRFNLVCGLSHFSSDESFLVVAFLQGKCFGRGIELLVGYSEGKILLGIFVFCAAFLFFPKGSPRVFVKVFIGNGKGEISIFYIGNSCICESTVGVGHLLNRRASFLFQLA